MRTSFESKGKSKPMAGWRLTVATRPASRGITEVRGGLTSLLLWQRWSKARLVCRQDRDRPPDRQGDTKPCAGSPASVPAGASVFLEGKVGSPSVLPWLYSGVRGPWSSVTRLGGVKGQAGRRHLLRIMWAYPLSRDTAQEVIADKRRAV